MASSPEYDKEPKAPDKSATTVSSEDSKLLHNSIHDLQTNCDPKSTHNTEDAEAENNKDVEALDDKSLQALLEEAIAYKGPKDREGKSSLFKELLEEAEQDDQASEAAAARSLGGCRGCSLQDLVAALAAEPAAGPRRHNARRHQPAPANVSTRATQGGSLPSGVDTSSLLSEEPARGAGYLATVRCVNPPPLAERRVSASDANAPHDLELLNRRSKPTYPMTYTARATLEIGSGSVCSGRAVTTTTASNQVRTHTEPGRRTRHLRHIRHIRREHCTDQLRLMSALRVPRGPLPLPTSSTDEWEHANNECHVEHKTRNHDTNQLSQQYTETESQIWNDNVNRWYEGLAAYAAPSSNDLCQSYNQRGEKNEYCIPAQYGSCIDYQENSTHQTTDVNINQSVSSSVNISNAGYSPVFTSGTCIELTKPMMDMQNLSSTRIDKSGEINAYTHGTVTNYLRTNVGNGSSLKKICSGRLGKNLMTPSLTQINPRNIRNMSIGQPLSACDDVSSSQISKVKKYSRSNSKGENIQSPNKVQTKEEKISSIAGVGNNSPTKSLNIGHEDIFMTQNDSSDCDKLRSQESSIVLNNIETVEVKIDNTIAECGIELKHISSSSTKSGGKSETFSEYVADQQKLFHTLEASKGDGYDVTELENKKELREFMATQTNSHETINDVGYVITEMKSRNEDIELLDIQTDVMQKSQENTIDKDYENNEKSMQLINIHNKDIQDIKAEEFGIDEKDTETVDICNNSGKYDDHLSENSERCKTVSKVSSNSKNIDTNKKLDNFDFEPSKDDKISNVGEDTSNNDRYVLAELPNNAYIFLTLPKRLLTANTSDDKGVCVQEIENNNNNKPYVPGNNAVVKPARKKKERVLVPKNSDTRKETFNKNALKVLLFENQLKSDRIDRIMSIKSRLSPITDEVDSAIPFSCITTPEVVASCNTTSSTSQSAVAVDAKPLQLDSSYRAVASLTSASLLAGTRDTSASRVATHHNTPRHQPRSVIPSSFNGLPLSRPNYGATATTAPDEYKKSLDENGNAVQGFSSPLAGSAQHKKPRRKKSSKNETVIDCRQLDGYQGDKDVNELLRFIESNAEGARAPKLGRAKHRDDADDKAGKKRSTERRKDKDNKVKRATSLEEVSRTKLEDLTAGPRRADAHHTPAGKPERRSWGDAREPDHDDPAAELTDFQTVTKKRKQRRRADEPAPRRTRAPSPPGPRHAPLSAPPSERSNDSNDDLDSAHSPPPAAPPTQPHASYADIARTRHNIPDLIESCNFYAEGEGDTRRAADAPPPPPADADGYPALDAHARAPPVPRRARDLKPTPPGVRRDRKERAGGAESREARAADCPAPDVVADRRPPVILLDAAARPRDMDGVTFGFDINEQLLSGAGRSGRPRCDLVRDALEVSVVAGRGGRGGCGGCAGGAALRYVPPDPPPDTHHLHQIIDYVGTAWEEVVRCGGGKVRYFSE